MCLSDFKRLLYDLMPKNRMGMAGYLLKIINFTP